MFKEVTWTPAFQYGPNCKNCAKVATLVPHGCRANGRGPVVGDLVGASRGAMISGRGKAAESKRPATIPASLEPDGSDRPLINQRALVGFVISLAKIGGDRMIAPPANTSP